jgi:hypothetical protein
MMKKTFRRLVPLLLLPLLFTGCATTITNLTPGTQKRSPTGLYPFEVAIDSRQQSLRRETLTPYVLIGAQSYPMQPTMLLENRWETLVPIPGDKEFVNYQFKFDYEYNSIPHRRAGSKLSAPYQLRILDQ